HHPDLPSFPTRRSSDLSSPTRSSRVPNLPTSQSNSQRSSSLSSTSRPPRRSDSKSRNRSSCWRTRSSSEPARDSRALLLVGIARSEEHTSELQSLTNLV